MRSALRLRLISTCEPSEKITISVTSEVTEITCFIILKGFANKITIAVGQYKVAVVTGGFNPDDFTYHSVSNW